MPATLCPDPCAQHPIPILHSGKLQGCSFDAAIEGGPHYPAGLAAGPAKSQAHPRPVRSTLPSSECCGGIQTLLLRAGQGCQEARIHQGADSPTWLGVGVGGQDCCHLPLAAVLKQPGGVTGPGDPFCLRDIPPQGPREALGRGTVTLQLCCNLTVSLAQLTGATLWVALRSLALGLHLSRPHPPPGSGP